MNRRSLYDPAVTSMPRRERERLGRRADILRAAEHVFAAKGYHRASIGEIARAAEYGTGTVYLYFKDKEALYVELFEQKIRELIDVIQRRIGKKQRAVDSPTECTARPAARRLAG